jgi:hypothetical protein
MKHILTTIAALLLVFTFQSVSIAQSTVTETFKKHFNETVAEVHHVQSPTTKRALMNQSFIKMMTAIDKIESNAALSTEQSASLNVYKSGLMDKHSELNGLDGFNEISDEDLDEFSSYAQDYFEQANRTVTIGVTTVLLILIILLLL